MGDWSREWRVPDGELSGDSGASASGSKIQWEDADDGGDEEQVQRASMHWHTPRHLDFKKVLDWRRYDEQEQAKLARQEEAVEAWQAITAGDEASAAAPKTVSPQRLKGILEEFDLNVDLADIGLEGGTDEQGNLVISFESFKEFTALTPRVIDGVGQGGEELRTVAGTVQMHPGSPIRNPTIHLH
mmetsp:Transcript_27408/g.56112  ORF Transcript_27408/g.56112 Transcript_27408/m.56112 type:complete len:186 (+) Transcript_27408:254-811(+)